MSSIDVRRVGTRVLALLIAATLALVPVQAQAIDPWLGTWTLDVFKSTYYVGEPPIRKTLKLEAADGGIKQISDTTRQGFNISETTRVEFTAKIDGKDYPVTNSTATVSLKRVNGTTIERTGRIDGRVSELATMQLAAGNKTLTITTKGSGEADAEVTRIEVFTRQP